MIIDASKSLAESLSEGKDEQFIFSRRSSISKHEWDQYRDKKLKSLYYRSDIWYKARSLMARINVAPHLKLNESRIDAFNYLIDLAAKELPTWKSSHVSYGESNSKIKDQLEAFFNEFDRAFNASNKIVFWENGKIKTFFCDGLIKFNVNTLGNAGLSE